MKFQIWFNRAKDLFPAEFGTFTAELAADEREAFEDLGFELQLEFEADDKEEANQVFINWCNEQTGAPNRVERIDLVGALQKAIEEP